MSFSRDRLSSSSTSRIRLPLICPAAGNSPFNCARLQPNKDQSQQQSNTFFLKKLDHNTRNQLQFHPAKNRWFFQNSKPTIIDPPGRGFRPVYCPILAQGFQWRVAPGDGEQS